MRSNSVCHSKYLMSTIFILTLFLWSTASANLIVGGSFEAPIVTGAFYDLDITPDGWTGTGDMVKQGYAGAVSSGDGNQWFDLNPNVNMGSGISQDIFLDAATTYDFSFLYNGGGGGSTTVISFLLESGSESFISDTVSTAGMNVYSGDLWNTFSTTFTTSVSSLATLSFAPNGSLSGGFIDGVTLIGASFNVPEPSAIWLFGSGIISLIGFSRRRKT